MEITVAIKALESLTDESIVLVRSDSRYLVNAFNKGSPKYWAKNRWLTRISATPVQNQDFWKRLLELTRERTIRFQWVPSYGSS